ncbi:MAG TPA: nuclear transport factor 2 family protein [Candidatus Aquilonibacter sp.]
MGLTDAERHAIEWECAQNIVRFYNRLDGVRGEEAAALFAEDGKWFREGDESAYTGRAEIAHHVNTLPARGNTGIAPELKMVFHLVNNVEVTVLDAETAEVRALTAIVSGARSTTPGEAGTTKGISSILRTLEVHKKTNAGWKIATKRTQRELRVA